MAFKSWRSYQSFSRYIKNKNRFFLDDEQKYFINEVIETAKQYEQIIEKDSVVCRAQLGHDYRTEYQHDEDGNIVVEYEVPAPYKKERMVPLATKAKQGRINPTGIPVFYCSNKNKIALSECRPWVGSILTLAKFKLVKELNVLNIASIDTNNSFYFSEPDNEEKIRKNLSDINKAYSKPIVLDDTSDMYAPTQVISEYFRNNGYDGIVYRSVFSEDDESYNIAIFDLSSVELLTRTLYNCDMLEHEYSQVDYEY